MERLYNNVGDFQAYYMATEWLRDNGYSYGSMQRSYPIGIMKGDYEISKWLNMNKQEIKTLDGIITGDMRNGPVKITIYEKAQ